MAKCYRMGYICAYNHLTLSLRSSTILFRGLRLLPNVGTPALLGVLECEAKEDRFGPGDDGSLEMSAPGRPAATAAAAILMDTPVENERSGVDGWESPGTAVVGRKREATMTRWFLKEDMGRLNPSQGFLADVSCFTPAHIWLVRYIWLQNRILAHQRATGPPNAESALT